MCVKFPPGDLNPSPYPPHPTSTYICGVITAPRVRGGITTTNLFYFILFFLVKENGGLYGYILPPDSAPGWGQTQAVLSSPCEGATLTKDAHQQEPAGSGNRTWAG